MEFMPIKLIAQHKCFDGIQAFFSHESKVVNCTMRFGVYSPHNKNNTQTPVLFWLSGLTCTEENFIFKAGAQRVASALGVTIIVPDTSPRNLNIPGDNSSYDFGVGAGFYLDAIEAPWSANYRMYTYIVDELFALTGKHFSIDLNRAGIFGHSMGGHGALTIALKNPNKFKSVSAFAPICAPSQSPWGINAFQKYLGEDHKLWQTYDATALILKKGWQGPAILIDQGTVDPYLDVQLKPELLRSACQKKDVPLNMRMQLDYDHSYFFVASFIEDHIHHHIQSLK